MTRQGDYYRLLVYANRGCSNRHVSAEGFVVVILSWIKFTVVGAVLLGGPWLFGAWEMWWFWGFTAVICLGAILTGLQLILGRRNEAPLLSRQAVIVLLSMLPFVVYAIIRWSMADVFMSAERSVMLHLTAIIVGLEIIIGLNSRQRRLLFLMIFVNLLCLGIYGLVNHLVWKSTHVLWVPRYPQYAGRATGTYFCPDHFAGIMELLLCISLGGLFARRISGWIKIGCGIGVAVAVSGVVLSQSRGGMMTLVVIFAAAMVLGVAQWPKAVRWYLRLIAGSAALLMLIGMVMFGGSAVNRIATYGGGWGKAGREKLEVRSQKLEGGMQEVGEQAAAGRVEVMVLKAKVVLDALSRTSRGRMYGGAWRAWQSAPWFGIGPGMHQNLWPQFAATADGDREQGIWPTLTNDNFHSYEVHSDWLQLLEEYGAAGIALFIIPLGVICFFLVAGIRREEQIWRRGSEPDDEMQFVYVLGGILAVAAMGFHSFGDFNLQMPATVWVLAAMLALGVGGRTTNED